MADDRGDEESTRQQQYDAAVLDEVMQARAAISELQAQVRYLSHGFNTLFNWMKAQGGATQAVIDQITNPPFSPEDHPPRDRSAAD